MSIRIQRNHSYEIFLLELIFAKRKYKIHSYFITLLKFSHRYNFHDFLHETIINYEPIKHDSPLNIMLRK